MYVLLSQADIVFDRARQHDDKKTGGMKGRPKFVREPETSLLTYIVSITHDKAPTKLAVCGAGTQQSTCCCAQLLLL